MRTLTLLAAVALISLTVPALADGCGNCAVHQPDTPVLQPVPGDGSCSGCALPSLSGQRAEVTKPVVIASPRCPSNKRVMGRCLQ
jgi:hypothetical protein